MIPKLKELLEMIEVGSYCLIQIGKDDELTVALREAIQLLERK